MLHESYGRRICCVGRGPLGLVWVACVGCAFAGFATGEADVCVCVCDVFWDRVLHGWMCSGVGVYMDGGRVLSVNGECSGLFDRILQNGYIVYLLRKVCTRVHALPYLQFESLLPHIKLSGCKIDVYYSPVMH